MNRRAGTCQHRAPTNRHSTAAPTLKAGELRGESPYQPRGTSRHSSQTLLKAVLRVLESNPVASIRTSAPYSVHTTSPKGIRFRGFVTRSIAPMKTSGCCECKSHTVKA
jgi:hypothetical protein